MIIRLDNSTRRDICLLCTTDGTTDGVTKWLSLFQAAIRYVDTISIHIGKLCIVETGCSDPSHPDLDREFFEIINKLPPRFDNAKVSY